MSYITRTYWLTSCGLEKGSGQQGKQEEVAEMTRVKIRSMSSVAM